MLGRYEFEGAEVLPLIDESRRARERLWTEAQRYAAAGVDFAEGSGDLDAVGDQPETGAPPGLWLMNDRGVYLRSNAAGRPDDSLAWARSYRADIQVGDEKFCEFIDAGTLEPLRADDTLVVTLTEDKVRLSVIRD